MSTKELHQAMTLTTEELLAVCERMDDACVDELIQRFCSLQAESLLARRRVIELHEQLVEKEKCRVRERENLP